jgi:hypothetical protein
LADTIVFSDAEDALVSTIISEFSQFTATNCKAHDFDSVFLNAIKHADEKYFAWTDFAGGNDQGRGIWRHNVSFTVGILFTGTATQMDDDIRTIINAMLTSFVPDNKGRLGGAVESARLTNIGVPESWNNVENNIPYVLIRFSLAIEERMPIGCR